MSIGYVAEETRHGLHTLETKLLPPNHAIETADCVTQRSDQKATILTVADVFEM